MYTLRLGEFIVPPVEDWVPVIQYIARPPLAIRGVMNPWAQERQRVLWTAEEAAWKKIKPLQEEYRKLKRVESLHMKEVQHWMRDLERLSGKKSGVSQAATYGSMMYAIAGGPYAWAAAIAKFGVDMILGIGKKKQAKRIMKRLEELGELLQVNMSALTRVVNEITPLLDTTRAVQAAQSEIVAHDIRQSKVAHDAAQSTRQQQATEHSIRVQLDQRKQSRQGAHNAL